MIANSPCSAGNTMSCEDSASQGEEPVKSNVTGATALEVDF